MANREFAFACPVNNISPALATELRERRSRSGQIRTSIVAPVRLKCNDDAMFLLGFGSDARGGRRCACQPVSRSLVT